MGRGHRSSWRQILTLYRSRAVFRETCPDALRLARELTNLGDDQLRVARILPDHSSAARAAIAAELARRGASPLPVPEPIIPSFFRARNPPLTRSAVRGPAIFTLIGGLVVLMCLPAAIGFGIWNKVREDTFREQVARDGRLTPEIALGLRTDDLLVRLRDDPEARRISNAHVIASVLFVIAFAALFGVMHARLLRRRPLRVVLLRKFNDPALVGSYKRLLKWGLSTFGHCVTLADHQIYQGADHIGGHVKGITTHVGSVLVNGDRAYRKLGRRLGNRLVMNWYATIRADACYVRSSDAWWQLVVRLVMRSSDVIVVDLSNVTDGTAWEIGAISELGLWSRVVPIVQSDRQQAGAETLERLASVLPPGGIEPLVYETNFVAAELVPRLTAAVLSVLGNAGGSEVRVSSDAEPLSASEGA